MIKRFDDRREGGRNLAAQLAAYKNRKDVLVLALPRGGVPVGFEVARALNAPLDVFLVRKLGVPGSGELALGAIASGGVKLFNRLIVNALDLPDEAIAKVIRSEQKEMARREKVYRAGRPRPPLKDKIVIVVDDGLATGATMRAAIRAIRAAAPKQVIAAAPVASKKVCDQVRRESDDLCICSMTPEPFFGVGAWYRNFEQTTDAEVCRLLAKAGVSDNALQTVGSAPGQMSNKT